jgi:hypothetical protein
MKNINGFLFLIMMMTACKGINSNTESEKTIVEIKETENSSDNFPRDSIWITQDIFNDTLFSNLNIDSLNGSFLRGKIVKTFFYDFKKWKDFHFDFFKTKEDYYDFGCYLISKQTNINPNIIGVIDLRCPPLEGATGYLYTINKEFKIIDSIEVVSDWLSKSEGNKEYYKGETNSKIHNDLIEIEKISYTCTVGDSCFIDRKETIKAKILSNGKIELIEKTDKKYAP